MSQLAMVAKSRATRDPIDLWIRDAIYMDNKMKPQEPIQFWIGKLNGRDQFRCLAQMALNIFSIPGIII